VEGEKAGGGTEGRGFAGGDTADCARANYGTWAGEGPCAPVHPGRPEPVGRYPQGASPYGALDLAGNVWEWVDALYPGSLGGRRVLRGGSCCSTFLEPRAANRVGYDPNYRDADIGFRCARAASGRAAAALPPYPSAATHPPLLRPVKAAPPRRPPAPRFQPQ